MYGVYKQTHTPTTVEHSVWCNFISTQEKSLVVAGTTQLHVYRLKGDMENPAIGTDDKTKPDQKSRKQKMELVASFSLYGNIMSLQSIQLAGSERDALLLSFMDAKLSIVEYDPGTHDLKTASMHYFEEEEVKDGYVSNYHAPMVRVDPEGRCAVMLIYGKRLVVLPFRKEGAVDESEMSAGSKSAILPTYMIKLQDLDERLINVVDLQFLHGYFDPTLLILYEPLQTWPGRVAVRQDTCCIVAVSLNIAQKVHPIIWSVGNLPFDCKQAVAVPKPIGGVLIFAVNSLLYLNQSVPPYGVSLNSISDQSTSFPLRIQEGVRIALDCAQASLISYDRLVISLKGGELYVLTLLIDGMRSVRGFHFDKAAASVLTCCMCMLSPGYLFLGSRLGNSLLLKYTEKALEGDSAILDTAEKVGEEPPAKKKKPDSDWMPSDVSTMDVDEIEVYGSEKQTGTHISSYVFEVCDSIMNIGPCGRVTMGEPAFLSEEFVDNPDPDIELVTTCGYGKNGALAVLQRSIRPQVVTTFDLPGCLDMWTVIGIPPESKPQEEEEKKDTAGSEEKPEGEKEETKEEGPPDVDLTNSHGFLILSREDSTMVLQTGKEIMELDHSGFSTQGPTVYAGNIGSNKYIIQVSPYGIRLLQGVKQLQHLPFDSKGPAFVLASVADPYALVMSEDGQILLLTLVNDPYGSGHRLSAKKIDMAGKSQAITVCAYRDTSGLFTVSSPSTSTPAPEVEKDTAEPAAEDAVAMETGVDDEEELLYGETPAKRPTGPTIINKEEVKPSTSSVQEPVVKEVEPTHWCVICRENGSLEIYNLPDFSLAYLVKNFPTGMKLLVDSFQSTSSASTSQSDKQGDQLASVKEILMVGLGHKGSRPHLLARVDEDLLIYEAFPYHLSPSYTMLKIRFKKVQHNLILRERKGGKTKKTGDQEDSDGQTGSRMQHFRTFTDISGYSGVFICGSSPHWLFMTSRGALRIHPMSIDGAVTCFSPFHNVNCPKGFLYFNRGGELRISVLPTHLSYDAPWPVRKVPLRCTPHFVAYHMECKVYAVAASTFEMCNRIPRMAGDEKEYDAVEKDDRYIYPMLDKFNIQLMSPVSWEIIPNTRHEFEEWEHISTMKNIPLKSEQYVSGMKGYIVAGTVSVQGEEVTTKGRIVILDVIEVVPEPGQPLTKNKIKELYGKEQKGPVSALCGCNGYLLSAIGQKIFLWEFRNNDLIGVAFIDTQVYIHTAISIKNYVILGDVFKSISLLRYQAESKTLSLVSRDMRPLETYCVEFFVDNAQIGFLVSDAQKNFLLYSYQPEARESYGGQRLVRRADFNVGSHVNTFFRVRCKIVDPSGEKRRDADTVAKRHVTMFATLDGGLGALLPMAEKTYRRLLMLQNILMTHMPFPAGLNPKAFRMLKHNHRSLINACRNILDGELLWKFLHLSVVERSELARKIGTTPETITEDLMDIDRLSAHF
ncbi:CPSF1 [Branchiostoma lanceolatum]|uniref:Cleavage and polyadenylation specificity factor subunit 1 n=1 Tax=Branchiostoma lanceolatum TaxID=7740 RepID=A0A8K0EUH8_BRALA|nr:CPSF1 [Branchiostoma lanceolatum]